MTDNRPTPKIRLSCANFLSNPVRGAFQFAAFTVWALARCNSHRPLIKPYLGLTSLILHDSKFRWAAVTGYRQAPARLPKSGL
jgi:hypothetical protein